jgi:hypothetical protein
VKKAETSGINPTSDVLIGQNLLIIPALLLEKKIPLDPGHFHDFCKLVNTLMMNYRLVTLQTDLPPEIRELEGY